MKINNRIIGWIGALIVPACILLSIAHCAAQPATNAPTVEPARVVITPQVLQQNFNAWSMVAAGAGAIIWHLLLKIWPPLKRTFPAVQNYCDARNGGVLTGTFRFLFGTPISAGGPQRAPDVGNPSPPLPPKPE